jgi:hypothetical protein
MTELIHHTPEYPSYHRRPDESAAHYEMFVEWCRIPPSSRNLGNYCRRTGFQPKLVKRVFAQQQWETRARDFDNDSMALRPDPSSMDDEAALAGQMAAASTLLELGLNALQIKNPSLINADRAIKLVEKGVEIQRRALGQADLNVQFDVSDFSRVSKLLEELDGNVVDAEVVADQAADDEAPDIPM